MKKLTYITEIKEGKIQLHAEEVYRILLPSLHSLEGKKVVISLELLRAKRSLNQNDYYWGVVIPSVILGVKETWDDDISKEQAHDIMKIECNFLERVCPNSEEFTRIPLDTKSLNTLQYEEFLERARKFIYTWFNIQVPLPNEEQQKEMKTISEGF